VKKIPLLAAALPFVGPYAVTPCSETTVHRPRFCCWQLRPMFIQSRMVNSAPKATTYVGLPQACRPQKPHLKLNRAFGVIQGHPYWCQQKSRTVCRRNVQ